MRNSKIILAKNINLDRNYKNVLNYTESQMLNLVNANKIGESNFNSFIRQNGNTIPTNFSYNQALQANYIAFQNPDYSQKWFFAWIDEIVYKNDSNIEIKYTIDAWSTWFEKLQLKNCFIVRETVDDDTIGKHTIMEDLNIGDLITDYYKVSNKIGSESYFWFVIASNYQPTFGGVGPYRYAGVKMYGDYPQGCTWFAWLINYNNYTTEINEISSWLEQVTTEGHVEDIQSVFVLPYQAFNITTDIESGTHKVINGRGNKLDDTEKLPLSAMHNFDDYSNVKNNKLYCYPYNFIRVTNNLGNYNDYHIEDFIADENDNIVFNTIGIPCLGYSGKVRPVNYKGLLYNEDESLTLGKYPTLSWSTDAYTNWLTQNSVNMTTNALLGTAGAGIGIATVATGGLAGIPLGLAYAGIAVSASGTLASAIGSINKASFAPNNASGNANSGDVSFAFNIGRFKFEKMRAKKEYLAILDSYFSRFGYKVNRLGTPNLTSRTYWNYVEIGQGEQVGFGEIPSVYLQVINSAFETGVTIWHNHANIGNYNLNNTIV